MALASNTGKGLEKKETLKNKQFFYRGGGMAFMRRQMVDSHERKEIAQGKNHK